MPEPYTIGFPDLAAAREFYGLDPAIAAASAGQGGAGLLSGILSPTAILGGFKSIYDILGARGEEKVALERAREAAVREASKDWTYAPTPYSDYNINDPNWIAPNPSAPAGYVQDEGGFYRNTNSPFDYGYYVLDAQGNPVPTTPPLVSIPKPTAATGGGGGGDTAGGGGSTTDSTVDTTIVDGDPAVTGADGGTTASSGSASASADFPWRYSNGVYTNVYTGATAGVVPGATPVEGRYYSTGGEDVYQPPGQVSPQTPKTPTVDWAPIISDWLGKNPNASPVDIKAVIEKKNVPAEAVSAAGYNMDGTKIPKATVETGGTSTASGEAATGTVGAGDTSGTGGAATGPTGHPTTSGVTSRPTTVITDPARPVGVQTSTSAPLPGTGTGGDTGTDTGPGVGNGTGDGTGPGVGNGTGDGTGPGFGLNEATKTTDTLFGKELFKFKQEYTLIGNLLSYANKGMFS